jgi:hypothetical protein
VPLVKAQAGKGKDELDATAICQFLLEWNPRLVVVEKQQAMIRFDGAGQRIQQGVTSTGRTMENYGLIRGILVGLALPYQVVAARTWQAVMHRDLPGEDPKQRSILAASRRFPQVDLRASTHCRKPHDGKADALLIAWYGRHVLMGYPAG